MACSSMTAYLQKPQEASPVSSYLKKTSSISVTYHASIIKRTLITKVRPRLSIKASSSSTSDPVIVKKLNADNNSPSKTSSPWLMLTPEMKPSSGVFKFYSVAEDKVITIQRENLRGQLGLESEKVDLEVKGSSHGWLALFDTYSSDLFLYNPLSNRHLKLPTIRNLEAIGEYDLESGECVTKVIISSSDPEGDMNCRALMIYGIQDYLAFCCPNSSNEWIETHNCFYDDVVCGDNNSMLFFGVNHYPDEFQAYPEFHAWDLKDLLRPKLISLEDRLVKDFGKTFPWKGYGFQSTPSPDREVNFLVASHCGQLFYVGFDCGDDECGGWDLKNMDFHVHKFDFEKGKLVRMDRSLGGLAFFIGRNHSFALCANEYELKPNSIYFTHPDDSYNKSDLPLGSKHMNIYNYEDRTFLPPFYTLRSSKGTPPMWYTPNCTTVI